jgi:hypothetical protein
MRVDTEQRRAILDAMVGRRSEADLFVALGTTRDGATTVGLELLRQGLNEHDADAVEFGMYLGSRFGMSREYLESLLVLASEPWHHSHEDIVVSLMEFKSPETVEVLYRTALARFPYLEYDDAYALGVKCIHALAAIGTCDAISCLGELARSGNPVLEAKATKQLARLATSAPTDDARVLARSLQRR